MPTYEAEFHRTVTHLHSATISVEADSPEDACAEFADMPQNALVNADDYGVHELIYEVAWCTDCTIDGYEAADNFEVTKAHPFDPGLALPPWPDC